MTRLVAIVCALCASFLAALASGSEAVCGWVDPHTDAGMPDCLECHLDQTGPGNHPLSDTVTCLSCHEVSSPWKYRLRVSPDAATPAVDLKQPCTYDGTQPWCQPPLTRGSAVSTTPLCVGCHRDKSR